MNFNQLADNIALRYALGFWCFNCLKYLLKFEIVGNPDRVATSAIEYSGKSINCWQACVIRTSITN